MKVNVATRQILKAWLGVPPCGAVPEPDTQPESR